MNLASYFFPCAQAISQDFPGEKFVSFMNGGFQKFFFHSLGKEVRGDE